MADSIAVLSPVDRVTSAGASVSGAKINFYVAGTSTPLVVYADHELTVALGATVHCDSDGFPVTAEGGTTKTAIYTGTADYKVIITDADDVTIITLDNLKGAIAVSELTGDGEVNQSVPVVAKSANYSVVAGDNGKLLDFSTTGGDCTATLPSAIDVGDGYYIGIRHNGTANELIIETVSSQTVGHMGAATEALTLTGLGETIWLASNGANWKAYAYVPPRISITGVITVADRLSAPPGSPADGARYILTAAPSGDWSSFAEHDLVEADGSGGWIRRTPPTDCGWIAYVQDEDHNYQFRGSAWVSLAASNTVAGVIETATQAEMEAATDLTKAATAGNMKWHPGVAKAWAYFGTSGNILASHNVTSVTDTGTGEATVNIADDMSSANYAPGVSVRIGGASNRSCMLRSVAAGTIGVRNINPSSGNEEDPDNWSVWAFGDFA